MSVMNHTGVAGTYVTPKRCGKVEITRVEGNGTITVYLRRWYLWRCKWFTLRLHHILRPDPDRCPHDHPTWFMSFVLAGSYVEHWARADRWYSNFYRFKRVARFFSFHSATDVHQIEELRRLRGTGVWTLVLTGPPGSRKWGFLDDDGWTPYEEWLAAENERAVADRVLADGFELRTDWHEDAEVSARSENLFGLTSVFTPEMFRKSVEMIQNEPYPLPCGTPESPHAIHPDMYEKGGWTLCARCFGAVYVEPPHQSREQ